MHFEGASDRKPFLDGGGKRNGRLQDSVELGEVASLTETPKKAGVELGAQEHDLGCVRSDMRGHPG